MQEMDPRRDEQLYHAPSPLVRFLNFLVLLACGIIGLAVIIGVFEHFKTIEQYSWWVVLAVVSVGVLAMGGLAGYWIVLRIRHAEVDFQAKKQAQEREHAWHEAEIERRTTQLQADERGNYPIYLPRQQVSVPPLVFAPGNAPYAPKGRPSSKVTEEEQSAATGQPAPVQLPTYVRYEEIRPQIPHGRALVGVSGRGIETKEDSVRALVWIVGGSGTGKTNTVCIRVDDDDRRGHRFLVIDPHLFKKDSLYNAIKGYASRFLLPVAMEPEEVLTTLNAFLQEFERRKAGGSWTYPVTIVVDEVGSLVLDIDKDNPVEANVVARLKEVARVCGQEARGFDMGGIFISQDAAGLAWLRKRALMVLAHQVTMWSERLLVCNQNTVIARDMDTWPVGRTLAYGIAFPEGQLVVQQPVFQPRVLEAGPSPRMLEQRAFQPGQPQRSDETGRVSDNETPPGAGGKAVTPQTFRVSQPGGEPSTKKDDSGVAAETKDIIVRLHQRGMPLREIAAVVKLGGEKYPIFKQVCSELGISPHERQV
jgi:hypothetical protein